MKACIAGIGSYVPARVLTNADLERMVATSDEWIRERTGIRERRIAATGEACSDLAVQAGKRALTAAGLAATDLDMILVATCTGDYPLPATACLVQHQLGATKAAACDLSAACCGFVYALSVADAYIKTGMRHVLVIGSEVMSAITDWTDRNTCVLFGDGAGAVVVSASDGERGILSTHLRSDGTLCELIMVPGGGSRTPPSEKVIDERLQYIKMKGNETFKVAVRTLGRDCPFDTVSESSSCGGYRSLCAPPGQYSDSQGGDGTARPSDRKGHAERRSIWKYFSRVYSDRTRMKRFVRGVSRMARW